MLEEKHYNTLMAGALLKGYREKRGLSQRDVAGMLGYRNVNFISMLESGKSNIPVARIVDIVNAYGIDNEMALVLLKKAQPDIWHLFKHLIASNPDIIRKDLLIVEKEIDKRFDEEMKAFGISPFPGMG